MFTLKLERPMFNVTIKKIILLFIYVTFWFINYCKSITQSSIFSLFGCFIYEGSICCFFLCVLELVNKMSKCTVKVCGRHSSFSCLIRSALRDDLFIPERQRRPGASFIRCCTETILHLILRSYLEYEYVWFWTYEQKRVYASLSDVK